MLRTDDLRVGYPGKPLFDAADLALERLECAALIGPERRGQDDLPAHDAGPTAPLAGHVTLGASLKVGYFAQAHEALNPDNTVIHALLAPPRA